MRALCGTSLALSMLLDKLGVDNLKDESIEPFGDIFDKPAPGTFNAGDFEPDWLADGVDGLFETGPLRGEITGPLRGEDLLGDETRPLRGLFVALPGVFEAGVFIAGVFLVFPGTLIGAILGW